MNTDTHKLYYIYEPNAHKDKTVNDAILEALTAAEKRFKLPEIKEVFVHPDKLPEVTIQSENLKIESAKFGGSKTGVKIYIGEFDSENSLVF